MRAPRAVAVKNERIGEKQVKSRRSRRNRVNRSSELHSSGQKERNSRPSVARRRRGCRLSRSNVSNSLSSPRRIGAIGVDKDLSKFNSGTKPGSSNSVPLRSSVSARPNSVRPNSESAMTINVVRLNADNRMLYGGP